MSQSEPPHSSESNSRRRTRRPSQSDQSRPRKRQQQTRPARFSLPLLTDRPESATSTATSINQYYSFGDEDALGNLFASYPQTFSSFPRPHGSRGLHEPPWELRFDHEIHLSNNFPSGRTRSQRVRIPVPGPETDLLLSASSPRSTQRPPTATRAKFESALKLVREVIGEEKRLTIELARSYERVHQRREMGLVTTQLRYLRIPFAILSASRAIYPISPSIITPTGSRIFPFLTVLVAHTRPYPKSTNPRRRSAISRGSLQLGEYLHKGS
ncbi:hypothetical protein FNYG_13907 [Fusarium nygamai]|uniref:Uncharacterized protein n=1 Tax=Gibberella nygamai TaxID=42673 RepID=A0A2K0UUC2_GIBNY|nr:hypothetical protein FNYG_13907 [Fusarium nygamai]